MVVLCVQSTLSWPSLLPIRPPLRARLSPPAPMPPQRPTLATTRRTRRRIGLVITLLLAIATITAQADSTHTTMRRFRQRSNEQARAAGTPSSEQPERAQIELQNSLSLHRAIYGRALDVVSTESSSASNAALDASSSSSSGSHQAARSSTGEASAPSMCATGHAGTDSADGHSCICNRGFSGPLCSVVSTDWLRASVVLAPLDSVDPSTHHPRARLFLQSVEDTVEGARGRTTMVSFTGSTLIENWSSAVVMFSADPEGQLTAEQIFDRFYAQTQDSSSALRRTEIGTYIALVSVVVCPQGLCSDGRQTDMFATVDPTPDTAHASTSGLDLRWFLPLVIGGGVLLVLLTAIGCYYRRKRSAAAQAAAVQPPAAAVAVRFSKHQAPDIISTVGGGSGIVSKSTGSGNGVGGGGGANRKVSRSGGEQAQSHPHPHPHHYDTTLAAANREKSLSKRWLELAGGQMPVGGALPPRPGVKTPSPALATRSLAGQPQQPRINSSTNSPITSRQGAAPKLATRSPGLHPQPHPQHTVATIITRGSGISVTELTSPSPAHSMVPQRSDGQHSDGSRSSQLQQIPRAPVRIHVEEDADNQV